MTLRSGEKPTTCTLNPPDTRVALRAVIAGEVEFTVVEVSAIFEGPFWILPVKPIVPVTVPVTSRRRRLCRKHGIRSVCRNREAYGAPARGKLHGRVGFGRNACNRRDSECKGSLDRRRISRGKLQGDGYLLCRIDFDLQTVQ